MTSSTTGRFRGTLVERMKGAALLHVDTYEEVEADGTATGQAALVVLIVALASGIGLLGQSGPAVAVGILGAVAGWLVWAGVTYLIGDKLLGGTATWGELLRTLGFAQSPGVLYAFGVVPLVGPVIRFTVALWVLVAGIIAIRQALDFSTGKAILTAVLGWLGLLLIAVLLGGWVRG